MSRAAVAIACTDLPTTAVKRLVALPISPLMRRLAPTVLIVNDEADTRVRFSRWLSAEGYQCRTAGSRAAALRAVGDDVPQVTVIATPAEGDGVALAEDLRARVAGAAVILVSDKAALDQMRLARRAGAFDCLVAPKAAELVAAVARATRQAEADAVARHVRTATAMLIDERHRALTAAMATACSARAAHDALRAMFHGRVPALFAHAGRVARVAVAIARERGVPADEIARVEEAALLHDIGKLALPEEVLLGDAMLGEAALEALLDHHARGLSMVVVAPALAPLLDTVAAVHECWDGSGYPAGLAGTDIPLGARIIAVADLLDAVQTWSVHHEPMTREDAHAALVREAGTRLDPDLVRLCLGAMERQSC